MINYGQGASSEEVSRNHLEHFVRDGYKIFIDTCSIMNENAERFWYNVMPLLRQYNNKIIVPVRCGEELEKHQRDRENPERAKRAKECIQMINRLKNDGYIVLRGEPTDNFADNVIKTVFMKFRMTEKLLLITQDRNLAHDILSFNNSKVELYARPVSVKKINEYGYLSNVVRGTSRQTHDDGEYDDEEDQEDEDFVPEEEKFEIKHAVTSIPDVAYAVSQLPGLNDCVYFVQNQTRRALRLTRVIGVGGEATTYNTDAPNYVAKIYKADKLSARKYEKLKKLLSKQLKHPSICFPTLMLSNVSGQFVGYLMPLVTGKELQRSIFLAKPLFLKNFPGWKKRDTVELSITILEAIKYLHDRNIIIGDINPANILIVSQKEVHFVDVDSFQIEDCPCPVGTINFTAPEIQRRDFKTFLRTMGNENFAVATLLFMIMLPGKPPYSQQGGDNPITNIVNMDFSYPFGDNSNKKTPDGPWRYIWSHLTYELKEAFYCTFMKGEKYASENTRLTVDDWIDLFRKYLQLLDSGRLGGQDSMSEELFPTRHKKSDKFSYVRCSLCGQETPEHLCIEGMCHSCLYDKGEVYRCSKCGRETLYSNFDKYVKHAKRYDVCFDCYSKGKETRECIVCCDCGRTFGLTNNEWEFYNSKGLDMPKRCPECREAKKSGQRNTTYTQSSYTPPVIIRPTHTSPTYTPPTYPTRPTTQKGPKKKPGSKCFITTAVCEYFGKDDDCYELTTLRNYRDEWLRRQPDGEDLINEYYRIAPDIVRRMKESELYSAYCETLMNRYIRPCIEMIENGDLENCKQKYMDMCKFVQHDLS